MAFNSNGYAPERSNTLPNGIYECIIRSAVEKQNSNGNYIEVEIQARGKKGWLPNRIFFNECPVQIYPGVPLNEDQEKKLKRWNRDLTTFFDAFNIPAGNFNVSSWVNHIGFCKVAEQYDSNEPDKKSKKFKALYPQVPEKAEQNAPIPSAPVNTPAPAPEAYQPAPESVTPTAFNDEEIPF